MTRRVAARALPLALAIGLLAWSSPAQELTADDVPSKRPTPRTASGKPDFSGYWKGTRDTKPGGNIGKDLPGWKLPLTPAGEAALKHNLTATIDPEALCIIGGIPRHNASGLPFEVLQGANKIAFLYWYSYFRLIPIDPNRKHSDDPDPSFFGEEIGRWEGDTLVIETTNFKDMADYMDPAFFTSQTDYRGGRAQLRLIERFTLVAVDALRYEYTVEDPGTWTRPWTAVQFLGRLTTPLYEYACHEGNYGMAGILSGARAADRNAPR